MMFKKYRKRERTRVRTIIVFFIVVGALLVIWWMLQFRYNHLISTPVNVTDSSRHEFVVEEGSSAKRIGKQLREEGLIRSLLAFKILIEDEGLAANFVAGRFALRKDQSMEEIVQTLIDPSLSEVWITTLEGWRVEEVASHLAEEGYADEQTFLSCIAECQFEYGVLGSKPEDQGLEGYLFPDTYIISYSSTEEEIIGKMVYTLGTKVTEQMRADIEKQGRTIHEIVTMASIIEREVRTDEDRPIVSNILWKRFSAGMGLGADATVLYALGDWRAPLTAESLATDSPYNTRRYRGLPPGPIASPGLKSVEAAIYPEESPYWFYLTTLDTGEVKYARTNEEHNANKAKYL